MTRNGAELLLQLWRVASVTASGFYPIINH
jgi:hypothetical protein